MSSTLVLAVACLAGCDVIADSSGAGGSGGAGGTSFSSAESASSTGGFGGAGGMMNDVTSSSSGSNCMEVADCKKCGSCPNGACGLPDAAAGNLCNCNDAGAGKSSLDTYLGFYTCICGDDGMSGKCGTKCAKTCAGGASDASDCMNCLGAAVGTTCKAEFTACTSDK